MDTGERRASMPAMSISDRIRPPPDGEEADSAAYDAEIKDLQKTLKELGIGRPADACALDVRPKQRTDFAIGKATSATRPSRSRGTKIVDTSEDYVPDYLVSPYLRPKVKGHLRVKDDVEDTGIVSPRMCIGARRRQSDPGRLTGAALMSLQQTRYSSISSDSSEDEEVVAATELRSPRARSPRRVFSSVPEDESYPASVMASTTAVSPGNAPGRSSPCRRLLQSRHAQSLSHPEESPRRTRRNRSNSLPLPDRTALAIGEAMGALVIGGSVDPGQHRNQALKRSRCISIEESPLESILEEAGSQRAIRRFSVPANIANAAGSHRLRLPKEC